MTLAFVMGALRRRIVLILITVVVVTGTGVAIGTLWPKTYTSTAEILLGLDSKESKLDPQTGNQYLKDRVATYAALVNADEVIGPVAAAAEIRPEVLRGRIVVTIVPETVVLQVAVSGSSPQEAVKLTDAVSSRFRTQVSSLNVQTGGPKILPAQLSSPQLTTEPDQLHGPLLFVVSALVGLLLAILVVVLLALAQLSRELRRSSQSEAPAELEAAAEPGATTQPDAPARPRKATAAPAEDDLPQMVTWD